MKSRLNDHDLAQRYQAGQFAQTELETVLEYLRSMLQDVAHKKAVVKSNGMGYRWSREYEALHAACYILVILLERQKGRVRADLADLRARGYERAAHIDRLLKEIK